MKRIYVNPNSGFFGVFQKVIKQVKYPIETITIIANQEKYKFIFQWQDENICGVDVFKVIT